MDSTLDAEEIRADQVNVDDDEDIDEDLEWELEEGLPQFEDPFIQKYLHGREALIEEEKKQRHDYNFKQSLSPMAAEASRIISLIREKELEEVWSKDFEEELAERNGGNLYPGLMFTLARDRMENTKLFKIIQKMPKGALLHAHLDAMIDIDWLVNQALTVAGLYIYSPEPLASEKALESAPIRFGYDSSSLGSTSSSIWSPSYQPSSFVPTLSAAESFPNGGRQGFCAWMRSRLTITPQESLNHHHGLNAVWQKFQTTFPIIGGILYYEPIFRASMQRMLSELLEDGIRSVDFRLTFHFEYRREGASNPERDYMEFFRVFKEEIEKFQATESGRRFYGARIIWTILRRYSNRDIIESMKQCIATKQAYPDMIAGFDVVGQEDTGRPLVDLIPTLFWFRKACMTAGVEIPFFFHAGECLGDGDEADSNLFDAILLGTRRIGHGFSLYKHPLLIDMIKEKKILVESCPISNEILRLTSSILSHPLPALLSRGVPVSLCNDDPAILGHGKNGLSHDFYQSLLAFQNLGLEGLATLAENSIRWSALEDQNSANWLKVIREGASGKGIKAARLRDWEQEFERFCQWVVLEYALEVEPMEDVD